MDIQKEHIIIRPMQLNDLDGVIRLSSEQGWNQTARDWRFMIDRPENICLLADYHGKIIATTTAINYSNDVAWISMVLVDQEYRGHGFSKSLLENILRKLSFSKSIKLDATPEGQRVYKGFDFKDEYLITRMTMSSANATSLIDDDVPVQPVQSEDIPAIIAFDEASFGANRRSLIESLIADYPHKAWMLKSNNVIAGFVLGRDGRKFNQIGPVMASNMANAKIMISKLLQESENQSIVVDVLNDKTDLVNWLINIGFIGQRHFVRMYQHHNPFPGNIDQQFLICGPEFG